MKKIAFLLSAALLAALLLSGCGAAKTPEPTPEPTVTPAPWEPLLGGWRATDSPEIPEDAREAFDKALEGLVGVRYTPVACLGTQVVAGTNFCILCQAQQVVPDPVPYYALVYVYRDLQGGAELLGIEPLHMGVPSA